jgi:hypothetical protein
MKDPTVITLMAAGTPRDPEGLCCGRFKADYETTDLDYDALLPGQCVTVDGHAVILTRIGKNCHPECPLVKSGRVCALKNRCAFGREKE